VRSAKTTTRGALLLELTALNLADRAVPLAFGHHPYFPRGGASLKFRARGLPVPHINDALNRRDREYSMPVIAPKQSFSAFAFGRSSVSVRRNVGPVVDRPRRVGNRGAELDWPSGHQR
jgi:galactose mutarotase-like enzyme